MAERRNIRHNYFPMMQQILLLEFYSLKILNEMITLISCVLRVFIRICTCYDLSRCFCYRVFYRIANQWARGDSVYWGSNKPAKTMALVVQPSQPNTLTLCTVALVATPYVDPTAVPATWVPCPLQSC